MTRDFQAVENRIDRGLTRARRQANDALVVLKADSAINAYVGGFAEDLQPDALRTLIARLSKAIVDRLGLDDAFPILTLPAALYSPDINPKDDARRAADTVFAKRASA